MSKITFSSMSEQSNSTTDARPQRAPQATTYFNEMLPGPKFPSYYPSASEQHDIVLRRTKHRPNHAPRDGRDQTKRGGEGRNITYGIHLSQNVTFFLTAVSWIVVRFPHYCSMSHRLLKSNLANSSYTRGGSVRDLEKGPKWLYYSKCVHTMDIRTEKSRQHNISNHLVSFGIRAIPHFPEKVLNRLIALATQT